MVIHGIPNNQKSVFALNVNRPIGTGSGGSKNMWGRCAVDIKVCPVCELPFVTKGRDRNGNQIYCSSKCWHVVRAPQITGVNNPCFGRKHTEEERRKMCERHYDCKGEKNPLYGVGHTAETKAKLRLRHLGMTQSQEARDRISKSLKARWAVYQHPSVGLSPSPETRKKLSEALKGPKCYLWKGGTSREPYPFEFNHELKESVRSRDKYQCQLCHVAQNGRRLPIHHIDYDKRNLDINNLISLCESCHSKTNTHREYYTRCFSRLIQGEAVNGRLFI